MVVAVKALAYELPSTLGLPLSRLSAAEVARAARATGIVATISGKTVWRWLHEDAVRPWQHRCWIFPRDPDFATKAGRILDLYAQEWNGEPLGQDDFVISADEKTSIQARARTHPSLTPKPGLTPRVEHEYERCAPGPTSPPSTCIAPGSLADAKPLPASTPSADWSTR